MRHPDKAGGIRPVLRATLVLATGRQAGDRGAVIIAVAIEDLVLLAAVALVGDLADHLEGLFIGLGAGVAVIDPAHARHLVKQRLGEVRARHGPGGAGEIVQLDQLVAHRIGNALAAVADVDRPDAARNRVEQAGAVLIPDVDALALDDDPRIGGLEGFVLGQMMPDVGLVGLDNTADIICAQSAIHGVTFCFRGQETTADGPGEAGPSSLSRKPRKTANDRATSGQSLSPVESSPTAEFRAIPARR